jgi:hypothetical protein
MSRILFVDAPPQLPESVEPVAARVPMSMSDQLACWIVLLCRAPDGNPITLTSEQMQLLRLLYDGAPVKHTVGGILAPCLALASLAGPLMGDSRLSFMTDDTAMWSVASPELRSALNRDGQGRIAYANKWPILTP